MESTSPSLASLMRQEIWSKRLWIGSLKMTQSRSATLSSNVAFYAMRSCWEHESSTESPSPEIGASLF
ncbi:unnamed protein product [Caretta caretta]